MLKNVASQKLTVFAFDRTTGAAKTGDAANLTAYVSKDDGAVTVLGDTSAAEKDATNAPGYYTFDLTQAETNANKLDFSGKSATANITVMGSPPTVYTRPANFQALAITAGGVASADAVAISGDTTAADRLETKLDRTVYINHDGNDATSGATAQAAIQAGGSVSLGKGTYEITFPLTPPAGTLIRGEGEEVTVLTFNNGAGGGSHDITMVSGVVFEDLTVRETQDGVIVNLDGATSAVNWGFRRCHIETANLEPFIIQSSSACSFFLEGVRITCNTEWAMAASGGAHLFYWDNVSIYVPANNSPTDYKAFGLAGSCTLLGNNIRLFTNEASDAGQAFRVADTAAAILTNCNFGMGDVNIEDATAFVRMTNCEFNRSGVTGFPARLDDVMSPTMPLVSFRKLGVESDGDLTKVNAIDTGGIAATSFAAGAIDATAIAANAITDAKVASDVTIASVTGAVGSVTGAVGSVTGNVGGNVVGSAGSISGVSFPAGFSTLTTANIQSGLATSAALSTMQGNVTTIVTQTGASAYRTAIGLASANLDTQLTGLALEATLNTARNDIVGEISAMQSDVDAVPTAAENAAELLATAAAGGENTVGQSLAYIRAAFGASGVFSEAALAEAPTGGGTSQPRINREPAPGFTIQISRRVDGTYKCTRPIRLTAGAVDNVYVFIDMSPLFGKNDFVETVGTAVFSAGSITQGDDNGPRDYYAVVELDGTATAGEERTVTVPVTMESATTVPVVFDVEVFE